MTSPPVGSSSSLSNKLMHMVDDEWAILRLSHIQGFEHIMPDGSVSTAQETIDENPLDVSEEEEADGGCEAAQ